MSKDNKLVFNDFTPIEPDPQYILQVNALRKWFPIKDGMIHMELLSNGESMFSLFFAPAEAEAAE